MGIDTMSIYPPGSIIANRYEVAGRPLMGGMGIVYLCLDHKEYRPVALKTFRPEYLPDRTVRDRFLREGIICLELGRHHHIVRCYGVEHIGDGCSGNGRHSVSMRSAPRRRSSSRSLIVDDESGYPVGGVLSF